MVAKRCVTSAVVAPMRAAALAGLATGVAASNNNDVERIRPGDHAGFIAE